MKLDNLIWMELLTSTWSIGKESPAGSFVRRRPIQIPKKTSRENTQIVRTSAAENVDNGVPLQRMGKSPPLLSSLKQSPPLTTLVTFYLQNITRAKSTNSFELFE